MLYADNVYVATNIALVDGTNTFTAIAREAVGRKTTNTLKAYFPSTVGLTNDANGNLLTDGKRHLEYDSQDRLTRVVVSNAFRLDYIYDGLNRRTQTSVPAPSAAISQPCANASPSSRNATKV